MVDVKYIFPKLDSEHKRRDCPHISGKAVPNTTEQQKKTSEKDNEKKEIPLFYSHKIRAARYEYF